MTTRLSRSIAIALLLAIALSAASAAQSLPTKIADRDFWAMIESLSEPDGIFVTDNRVSNEIAFQQVIPELRRHEQVAYLGVGPEQNFTYITALKPQIAFIVDIRRQNLLLHLLYKAVVELSADRNRVGDPELPHDSFEIKRAFDGVVDSGEDRAERFDGARFRAGFAARAGRCVIDHVLDDPWRCVQQLPEHASSLAPDERVGVVPGWQGHDARFQTRAQEQRESGGDGFAARSVPVEDQNDAFDKPLQELRL